MYDVGAAVPAASLPLRFGSDPLSARRFAPARAAQAAAELGGSDGREARERPADDLAPGAAISCARPARSGAGFIRCPLLSGRYVDVRSSRLHSLFKGKTCCFCLIVYCGC